jgi:uncharacterized membrane protein YcaP (DUF421 family)
MERVKAERVLMDDLMAAARNEGIERFGDIRLAVLETNGQLSFLTAGSKSGSPESPPIG